MNEPKHNFRVGDIVTINSYTGPFIITHIDKSLTSCTAQGCITHALRHYDVPFDKLSYPKGDIEPIFVTVEELKSGRTPFLIPGLIFRTAITTLVLASSDPLEFRFGNGKVVELSDDTRLRVSTGGVVNIPEPKVKRNKNMRIEELNKNNKYTYRRAAWGDFASHFHLVYDPEEQDWMVRIDLDTTTVVYADREATDWYETDKINPHYIEESQVPIEESQVPIEEPQVSIEEKLKETEEPADIIIPTPWKNPKPNVTPSRRTTKGQWVVRDNETPGIIESQQLQTPTPAYPLFEQKQKAIKTGMFVELNQTIANPDTLYIVKRKIKDQIELVCGTMVKMEDVMRYYDFKPEEVIYDIYSCGTVVTESSEVFDSLEELTESYGSGTKLKVRSEHAARYEYLQISEHFNVPIGTLKPKDEDILDEIKTALDHPINVADKEWVLLVGKSGSGKTEAAVAYAESVGKEYIKLQGSAQVTVDDLIGYNSITTGEYFPSLLRDAVENGNVFILDEIDACNPNTLLVLNGLKQGYFQFPDKLVKIHPEFRFIATANTLEYSEEYLGRSPMDKATLARFYTINYEMAPVDLAIRYGLNNIKKIEGVDRLTPREIAREVRKIRIEELNTNRDD